MSMLENLFPEAKKKGKVRFKAIKDGLGSGRFQDKRTAREIATSVSRGATEVIVKVSGYTKGGLGAAGKGSGRVSAHINYISRHGKIQMETGSGEIISGKSNVKDFCSDWQESIDAARKKENSRDVMHLVLSMPGKQDAGKMRVAIRNFAANIFGEKYEYAFVLHDDTENTHGHLAVKCRGFDGKQMQMRPGMAQEWRMEFAASLRAQGIDAEASPRSCRGVLRKSEPQAFRHMEKSKPDSTVKRRIPEMRKKQIREAMIGLENIGNGKEVEKNFFAEKAKERILDIKKSWVQAANELDDPGSFAFHDQDEELAWQIRRFVEKMPEVKTRQEVLREKMLAIGSDMFVDKMKKNIKNELSEEREPDREL